MRGVRCRHACGRPRSGVRIGHRVRQDQDARVRQRERGPERPLRLRSQHDDLRRGGEHAAHHASHQLAPRTDICGVIVVVDVQDIRQRYRAGDGRKHQFAQGAAAAGDVHVQQAGLAGNPRPRNSERRSQKVENGQGDPPARATEEPRPASVDNAIRRRLGGMRQSGQEIAHLPPDPAAVLQTAGTKHENADRWRREPITGT